METANTYVITLPVTPALCQPRSSYSHHFLITMSGIHRDSTHSWCLAETPLPQVKFPTMAEIACLSCLQSDLMVTKSAALFRIGLLYGSNFKPQPVGRPYPLRPRDCTSAKPQINLLAPEFGI
jgi:hypothetical protein